MDDTINPDNDDDDENDDEVDEAQPRDTRSSRAKARDDLLLDLLASGISHIEAAAMAGCSTRTVQRRLQDDEFARELARRRSNRLDESLGRLTNLVETALSTIEETMHAENAGLRYRAAATVVSMLLRFRDEQETQRRLNRVEQQMRQLGPEEAFPSWTTNNT